MAKAKKVETPVPVVLTPEQERARMVEWAKRRLDNWIEDANNTRTTLINHLQKGNGEAAYQMRWLEGKGKTFFLGSWAEEIKTALDGKSDEDCLKEISVFRDNLKEQKDRWYPEHSSSPYSNAMNEERFNALREILTYIGF